MFFPIVSKDSVKKLVIGESFCSETLYVGTQLVAVPVRLRKCTTSSILIIKSFLTRKPQRTDGLRL